MAHKIPLCSEANSSSAGKNESKGLYKIIGTLVANNQQKFCPILLEISDSKLIKKENNPCKYLLQVWTQKGEMIYEQRMERAIRGWYMDNCRDVKEGTG